MNRFNRGLGGFTLEVESFRNAIGGKLPMVALLLAVASTNVTTSTGCIFFDGPVSARVDDENNDTDMDMGVDVPDLDTDMGVDVPDLDTDMGVDVPDLDTDMGVDVPDLDADMGVDQDMPVDMPPVDMDMGIDQNMPDDMEDMSQVCDPNVSTNITNKAKEIHNKIIQLSSLGGGEFSGGLLQGGNFQLVDCQYIPLTNTDRYRFQDAMPFRVAHFSKGECKTVVQLTRSLPAQANPAASFNKFIENGNMTVNLREFGAQNLPTVGVSQVPDANALLFSVTYNYGENSVIENGNTRLICESDLLIFDQLFSDQIIQ